MSVVVWVDPADCDPPHGLDLQSNSDSERVNQILADFLARGGFDTSKPALIAYPLAKRIQLLSGTHRLEAARRAGIKLPVVFWLCSDVQAAWGQLEVWQEIMRDIPVAELETWTREDLYRKVKRAATPHPRLDGLSPEPRHTVTRVVANTSTATLSGLDDESLWCFAEELRWHYENVCREVERRRVNGVK